MVNDIEKFDELVIQASRVHAHTWCVKRQMAIPTYTLKGSECCLCDQFVLNKGICDPL